MIKRLRPLLGTFVEIAIADDTGSLAENQIQTAINAAFSRIEKIQQQLSFHDPNSNVTRLNCADGNWVSFSSPGIYCLKLARALTRISNGAFNCTLGKALVERGVLPAPSIINTAIKTSGNWRDIEICRRQVRLRSPLWITLDGIAKGFAVDQGIKTLQQFGISSAWINAGGDIRVYGSTVMPITIRDHCGNNHPMGGLQNAAIATSTTHNSTEFPGLLLNAEVITSTSETVPNNTWTVISRSAWRADALTKVAASTAVELRKERIASLGGNWIDIWNEH